MSFPYFRDKSHDFRGEIRPCASGTREYFDQMPKIQGAWQNRPCPGKIPPRYCGKTGPTAVKYKQ